MSQLTPVCPFTDVLTWTWIQTPTLTPLCVCVCVCSGEADLEQVKLSSRRSRADEEVFGEQETLALSFLPQRERAQADLTEHAPLAAGRQLDQRAWTWSRSEE